MSLQFPVCAVALLPPAKNWWKTAGAQLPQLLKKWTTPALGPPPLAASQTSELPPAPSWCRASAASNRHAKQPPSGSAGRGLSPAKYSECVPTPPAARDSAAPAQWAHDSGWHQ